jgi:hypothetical protein
LLSAAELDSDGPAGGAADSIEEKDELGPPTNGEKLFEVNVELNDDGSTAGAVNENDELRDSIAGSGPGRSGPVEYEELCDASRL